VKVTDFGLAKSLEGDVGASGGGLLLGTPTYMSPEQCRGRGVDVRTDIYGLGLTAWFLLGGKPPFRAESLGQMLQDQMNTPLPSLRESRPDLPPSLDRALARLCEKDPEKRPKSMEEVAGLIEAFRPRPLEPATFAARASAAAIDNLAVLLVGATVSLGILALENWINLGDFVPRYVYACIWAGTLLSSQYVLEAWLSTTVGKWLFNLETVRENGTAPSRMALFVRFLLRYPLFTACIVSIVPGISAWIIGIGWALQVVSFIVSASSFPALAGRTLWDKLTKIRVVYRRANA
jgi:uncharacterized RDD family membrane protein YckC